MSTSASEAVADIIKLGDQEVADAPSETQDRQRRAGLLLPVLETVKELRSNGQLDQLSNVATVLGNAVRNEVWRLPVGDSGLLKFFLEELARSASSQDVHVQCLRIVGNSCAYTDENRQRFIEQGSEAFERTLRHFQNSSLLPFLVSVLYNTLVDYAPAQLFASENKLSEAIITAFSNHDAAEVTDSQTIQNAVKILWLLMDQEGEAGRAHPDTISVLLSLAPQNPESDESEDYIETLSTALAYLSKEPVQNAVVADESGRGSVLQVFSTFEVLQRLSAEGLDENDASVLKELKKQLLNSVADLTANDGFAQRYPIGSAEWDRVASWLTVNTPSNFPTAACLAMGNISRSDEISRRLVEEHHMERFLAGLLSDSSVVDSQLVHSALSFARNLAVPPQNKPVLGDMLFKGECLPRILALDTLPEVQFRAMALTRLLLAACPLNVRAACSDEASVVSRVVSLFKKSDAEPTQLEAARSISAICRVLHFVPGAQDGISAEDLPQLRERFYANAEAETLLAFLITQKKWPVLASETWFVLALMCRSLDGAHVVLKILDDGAAMNQLVKTVTGREEGAGETSEPLESQAATAGLGTVPQERGMVLEPQEVDVRQKEDMGRADRENAVVLCTELLKATGDTLALDRAAVLRQLITEGTELVAQEKNGP